MMELGWVLLGFAGVWIGYQFLIYPLLLALVARWRRVTPRSDASCLPTVSVLVSARNEEKDILWKIQETLAWDYPAERLNIFIASDASTDRTEEIVRSVNDPRVRLLVIEKRGGKNRALNQLAELADGELLFFTDANSHINSGCVRRVARHFADQRVGCVTGNSNSAKEGYQPGTSSGASVYWGHELLIRHLENQFGSVLVCDGAIFCIRRQLYAPVIPDLANDLELPLRIGGEGHWILHEPTAQVLEKDTSSPIEEFSRRRRICAQGALGLWLLREHLHGVRLWQFLSHKVLRWLLAVPMVCVLIASILLSRYFVFELLLAGQVVFYCAALLAYVLIARNREPGRLLTIPLYVVVGVVGAAVGVVDACGGRRFDTWESPLLSRGSAEGAGA